VIDRRALLRAGFGGIALAPFVGVTAQRAAATDPPATPGVTGRRAPTRRAAATDARSAAGGGIGHTPPGAAPLAFPRDHGAHPEHRIEWWYLTGWLWPGAAPFAASAGAPFAAPAAATAAAKNGDPDAAAIGFQVTFFRARTDIDSAVPGAFAARQLIIAHAALADPTRGSLLHDQRIARTGFGIASAAESDTDVVVDRWSLRRAPDGTYTAVIDARGFALRLTAQPRQRPLLQGDAGYSRKGTGAGESSFYYSQPHLAVSAQVTHRTPATGTDPAPPRTLSGEAWLDHEWSNRVLGPQASGWDWIGINLLDGGALTAFRIRAQAGAVADPLFAYASLRDAQGKVQVFGPDAVRFTPLRRWTSPRTRADYPVAVRIEVGARTFESQPLLDDQELDSRMSTGAVYWEGASRLLEAGRLAGRGYLEMTGYVVPMRL
jgi:predicted secreted hydrolase